MNWLKKTREAQEFRERARRLVEEKKKEEKRKQEELRQQTIKRLKAEWERLKIDKIIEDIKTVIFPKSEVRKRVDDVLGDPAHLYQCIAHLSGWDVDYEYGRPSTPRYATDFAIALHEHQIRSWQPFKGVIFIATVIVKINIGKDTFLLRKIPDADSLREKIDQYLARRLEKGERK